jgi:choline dehydrogenase
VDDTEPRTTDYLVVGGGSAGCAAARVLADQSDAEVILLESGGTNDRDDVRSLTGARSVRSSGAVWSYNTVPQPGTDNRVHPWETGRLLGGSSSINGMMYMRGAPWDYDGWAALGNPGWDASTVYATYRRLEDLPNADPSMHGVGGPIKLVQVDPAHPLTAAFLAACRERGYKETPDFNGLEPEGYGTHQLNAANGRRQDAATAFLTPISSNKRLTILTGATACQLVFDRSRTSIEAVTYLLSGRQHTIRVRREVILSSGAIGSPQLLMLSGIGPADELQRLGIDMNVALEGVGKNLHDHVGVIVGYEAKEPFPETCYQFLEAGIYLRSDPSVEHYDLHLPMRQLCEYIPFAPPINGYSFFGGLLTPQSRGQLTLASSNPLDLPVIDPGYLTDPGDLNKLVSVIGFARDIGTAPAFEHWRGREVAPGDNVVSREQLRDYVRLAACTFFHPVGTCMMGAGVGAVVDSRLRVYGVRNLRVADASVMPFATSGGTNAPAMMIGWRAGEFALEDGLGE